MLDCAPPASHTHPSEHSRVCPAIPWLGAAGSHPPGVQAEVLTSPAQRMMTGARFFSFGFSSFSEQVFRMTKSYKKYFFDVLESQLEGYPGSYRIACSPHIKGDESEIGLMVPSLLCLEKVLLRGARELTCGLM